MTPRRLFFVVWVFSRVLLIPKGKKIKSPYFFYLGLLVLVAAYCSPWAHRGGNQLASLGPGSSRRPRATTGGVWPRCAGRVRQGGACGTTVRGARFARAEGTAISSGPAMPASGRAQARPSARDGTVRRGGGCRRLPGGAGPRRGPVRHGPLRGRAVVRPSRGPGSVSASPRPPPPSLWWQPSRVPVPVAAAAGGRASGEAGAIAHLALGLGACPSPHSGWPQRGGLWCPRLPFPAMMRPLGASVPRRR